MKSNRMFGILSILLDKKQVTAKELAEYFEVSVRTIHRDLLDLSSAGFPVITQQGVGGGISLMPNFRYNKSALSKDDMDVILAGIQGLSIIDDSTKIKTLLAKLRFSSNDKMLLENDIVIDFSTWNHNSTIIKKIRLIRVAIANHNLLNMKYYSSNGYRERIVEPYKLLFKQESWYMLAYCHYRNDFRIPHLLRLMRSDLVIISIMSLPWTKLLISCLTIGQLESLSGLAITELELCLCKLNIHFATITFFNMFMSYPSMTMPKRTVGFWRH